MEGGAEGKEETKNAEKKALFCQCVRVFLSQCVSVCVHVHLVRVPLKGLLRNWRACGWRCSRPSPILGVITQTENEK